MRPTTLRTRFLAVIVLCVLLPMLGIGAWVARSARRSGEEALRLRLESALRGAEQSIGYRWIEHRSALHALAADERVRQAIGGGPGVHTPTDDPTWTRLAPVVERVLLIDGSGAGVGEIRRDSTDAMSEPFAATVDVLVPVYESALGAQVGALEARVRLAYLLPPGFWSVGIGGGVVALFDEDGQPLIPSPLDAELLSAPRFTWNEDDWVAVRRTLYDPPLQIAVAAPLGPVEEPFLRATRQGLVALLAVSVLALAAATLLTARLTRSLESVSAASEAVAAGRLDHIVPEVGSDDVRRLSRSFNAMTTSLRSLLRTVAQQRAAAAVGEFAASLAHEVRNPLSAVRLDLEHLRGRIHEPSAVQVLDEALAQIDRLDATVSGALRIAASGTIELTPLDVRAAIAGAVRGATPRGGTAGVKIAAELPAEALTARGNHAALEQLLLNLLLNAVEASPPGGRVRLAAHLDGALVRIEVEDDGAGMTADQLARAFEPFFTTKAEGTGLGLPVARRIALAHGGELHLEPVASRGTRAVLTLPRNRHE